MAPKRAAYSIVMVSLAFAVAMIGSSIMIADREVFQTVNLILVALWFIPFAYFTNAKNRKSDKG